MARSTRLDCTVIILSYNSRKVTDVCLTKLKQAVTYCEEKLGNKITVVVVENGSHDGSAAMIRQKHSWVHLKALKKNIGFAAGNNLAMKSVRTPYILLMNSDTYVTKEDIYTSLSRMQSMQNTDVLVSRWTPETGVFENYGGYLPTPVRIVLWSFGLESIPVIRRFLHRMYSYNSAFYTREGEMEWCPIVFMLLKKHVYTKTKGLDERMWFHMVDVEWCYRMRQQGLKIRFTPTVQVLHLGGASSKGLEHELLADNYKGLMYFSQKHFPRSLNLVSSFVRTGVRLRSVFYYLLGASTLANAYLQIAADMQV